MADILNIIKISTLANPPNPNLAETFIPVISKDLANEFKNYRINLLDVASIIEPALNITATIPLIVEEQWISAGAMTPRDTNGANPSKIQTTTNLINYDVFEFSDSVNQFVNFQWSFPQSWNEGTIKAKFYWTATSTGTVKWNIKAGSLSSDTVLDTSYGTGQTVTSVLSTINTLVYSNATPAITIGNTPSQDDLIYFEIERDATNGSDTLSGLAGLIGVKIQYTTNINSTAAW